MVTITESKTVCSVCRNPRRKVAAYRVGQDGVLVTVDLCKEHGTYVEELIALGTIVPFPSSRVKVWDIEEIETRKAQRRKAAPNP
jgi:hypothetical protein